MLAVRFSSAAAHTEAQREPRLRSPRTPLLAKRTGDG